MTYKAPQPHNSMSGQNQAMHPDDKRNLILFIMIALALYFGFDHFIMKPKLEAVRAARIAEQQAPDHLKPGADVQAAAPVAPRTRDAVIADGARIKIDNGAVFGTIPTRGLRIDDMQLSNYFKTLGGTDHVPVLAPAGTAFPKYFELGWIADDASTQVPDKDTQWSTTTAADGKTITMRWTNAQGVVFHRDILLDDRYVLSVRQSIENKSGRAVTVYPYGLIAGIGLPEGFSSKSIGHEGPIGYIGDELHEVKYKALDDKGEQTYSAAKGWVGITEKYWLTALIPQQGEATKYRFVSNAAGDKKRYQADFMGPEKTIAAGERVEFTTHVFAGAKEVRQLDRYERELNTPHFDLAVDFGLWYFLTKPFFYLLSFIVHHVGNFGIAIIIFTILLRGALFPLNNTSYRSFAKLKKVAPEMTALRDQYKDDKQKLQKELIALYTREKVNPAAGCLPILLQIPIFFALYKVLSVTIEMRHAPFFGWIHDLSAPDPTSFVNMFGLLPFDPPGFLMIGIWPCLMLLGMLIQKSMNPPPQDPIQAQMMNLMPWFMTFIMAGFASGLVIYWTVSNLLSIIQQFIIMKSMGVEVKFFHKSPAEEKLEEQVKHGPAVHPGAEMIEDRLEHAILGDEPTTVTPPKGRRKKKR